MARRRTSLGCLFWIALILLTLVVFLFNRERISSVIRATGFLEFITGGDDRAVPEPEPASPETRLPQGSSPRNGDAPDGAADDTGESGGAGPTVSAESTETEPADGTEHVSVALPQATGEAEDAAGPVPQAVTTNDRVSRLYFVSVDDSGSIGLESVLRTVDYGNTPLTATLAALIDGPDSVQLARGVISVIPPETEIRAVRVRDGTAIIDLSEHFRFNSLGLEGYRAQLRQLVYTATEFPTVHDVQILINGERVEFLGPEGVFIGNPLSRDGLGDG